MIELNILYPTYAKRLNVAHPVYTPVPNKAITRAPPHQIYNFRDELPCNKNACILAARTRGCPPYSSDPGAQLVCLKYGSIHFNPDVCLASVGNEWAPQMNTKHLTYRSQIETQDNNLNVRI